jgi:hypothetical protein
MAELGVLANLVAVVGAGLQLSVGLYDFASTLGSAGREIEDIGYDITLLCAVLKRVQSTLDNPKSTRLSAHGHSNYSRYRKAMPKFFGRHQGHSQQAPQR